MICLVGLNWYLVNVNISFFLHCRCFPHVGDLSILDWPMLGIYRRQKFQFIYFSIQFLDMYILSNHMISCNSLFWFFVFKRREQIVRCNLLFTLIGHLGLLKDVHIYFFLSFILIWLEDYMVGARK